MAVLFPAVTTIKIADANVTTAKIADSNVTDAKILTVSGAKVTGDIPGNAANVNGVVAIANGGTSANTLLGARTNLGIQNDDERRYKFKVQKQDFHQTN